MASVTAVLRKNKKADGTYPLVIRIIKDRKTSYISLGHHINEEVWDAKMQKVKKSHPNSARLNNLIAKKVSEASDKLIELQTNNTDNSSRTISNAVKSAKEGTFFKQAKLYCQQLKASGKFNRLSADEPRINRFKEFLDGQDINFSEITVPLLKRFKVYLKGTRNISERTIINHLVVIRTIYNQGISAKLVDAKYYPFGKGGIVIKFPDSLKIGLTIEDIRKIESVEVDRFANHARNLWLFSFYFAGMRISDVLRLKWSDFQNNRLFYKMGKNEKGGSLKIPQLALNILEQYKRENSKHDLVFPDLEKLPDLTQDLIVQSYIKTRIKANNKQFQKVVKKAEIKQKVTMHIARHSFGNISGDQIPVQMLQKLYRHTHISTTMGYQANFIHKDADDALDSVIGL
ncbi:MAG: site-specific integrase [Bacteroidota bacterium]